MLNKVLLIFNTLKYLKLIQLFYQVLYRIKPKRSLSYYKKQVTFKTKHLDFINFSCSRFIENNESFRFLNLEHNFGGRVNWNFMEFGKLWNYNLQYFFYLNQQDLPTEIKWNLLADINENLYSGNLALEPYPTSLRIINTIRFVNTSSSVPRSDRENSAIEAIYAQTDYLYHNLEYHILGNHLLENAFALLISAEFFENNKWKKKALSILVDQLNEQVLSDGAHFELSPLYHQIMFARVLEAISITTNLELKSFLIEKASKMLAWLKLITFRNGAIPHFNDSTDGIAWNSAELFFLANSLEIPNTELSQFSDSGYRKFYSASIEVVLDVHGISPTYQPGHAHADHLSFTMNYLNEPFIVDPGISTYNPSARRSWERSSVAHNTVTVSDHNQSEVWGGFRVAKRAKVKMLEDGVDFVKARLTYVTHGNVVCHDRELQFRNGSIQFYDVIEHKGKAVARYYLHPNVIAPIVLNHALHFSNNLVMTFSGAQEINISNYKFSQAYNTLIDAKVIEVQFDNQLKLKIAAA